MSVEKGLDELWVGVKGQSNLEIARTLRNAFRCSLDIIVIEVELLIGCGGFTTYQFLTNSECYVMFCSSEGMGAKVHCQKGNNPDYQLKSLNIR